jgi:hypothetical protein
MAPNGLLVNEELGCLWYPETVGSHHPSFSNACILQTPGHAVLHISPNV